MRIGLNKKEPDIGNFKEYKGVKQYNHRCLIMKAYGENKKIILSLGRINWKKGFDTLIPAFAEVLKEEPNAVLVIAGKDDGYKKEAENLVKKHNLQEKVFLLLSL